MSLETIGAMLSGPPSLQACHCDSSSGHALVAMVRGAFPDLPMNRWQIDQSGGDHVLLVVENQIVFRFPRQGTHNLDLEIAVLRALHPGLSVATPSYDFVDPAGRFAGYPRLSGTALTLARFDELSPTARDGLLRSIALFLSQLHRLAPSRAAPQERWPLSWTAAQFAERGRIDHLPVLANYCPGGASAIEAFFVGYAADHPPYVTVLHGDLVPEHILVNEYSGQLSGIIDFGDVALGDPAQDFLGLWSYGEDAARRVVDLYERSADDPGLLARACNHYIRYRLDRLVDQIGSAGLDRSDATANLAALLALRHSAS